MEHSSSFLLVLSFSPSQMLSPQDTASPDDLQETQGSSTCRGVGKAMSNLGPAPLLGSRAACLPQGGWR